jgi:translation initiation factor IF-3
MIRAKEIRVIDEETGQLGIMSPEQALALARSREMDLVEVAPGAAPPVCRIMNYGKFQYQKSKRAHEAKKHQKQVILKEVKFRPRTDDHDFEFKKNNIVRFLNEGNKAKATVVFRGREMTHQDIGRNLMERLVTDLREIAEIERSPKMEGYTLVTIFAPKKK